MTKSSFHYLIFSQGAEECLLASEMKLKMLFCQCVRNIVDLFKEGKTITEIEAIMNTEALSPFMHGISDNALKIVAYKVLLHNDVILTNYDELLKTMEPHEALTGLKAFLCAIEMTGVECNEIIPLVELNDILVGKENLELLNISEPEVQVAHAVIKSLSLDALMELTISKPNCMHERPQLQTADVYETQVIIK